jgi:hypothetical protein
MVPAALWDEVEGGGVLLGVFVVRTENARWGSSYREATIGEARANAAMRERRAA